MRASDQDRQEAALALADAYAEGRLDPDEFEERRVVLGLHHRLLQVRHFGSRSLPALDADLSALGW